MSGPYLPEILGKVGTGLTFKSTKTLCNTFPFQVMNVRPLFTTVVGSTGTPTYSEYDIFRRN